MLGCAEQDPPFCYGVSPSDPVSLWVTATVLTGVTFVASYLPARRAAGVDPNRALRGD